MTHIPAIDANRAVNSKSATYNAVKIQVNDPRTNIPEGFKSSPDDEGTYNAVAIEVNRPSVEAGRKHGHHHKGIYDYPQSESLVTSDMAPIHPIDVPVLPVAYQTNNFINNRTLINAEVELKNKTTNAQKQEEKAPLSQEGVIITEEIISVPEPNVTTTEEQKADDSQVAFHGISFKANESVRTPEIVPPVDIKPEVDVPAVIANLSSPDFDVQAKQMEEIARVSMEDTQKAVPYIVTEIFSELINIVQKDTTGLVPPSEKQMEIRKQIIVNEIIKEQAEANNQDPEKVELPYTIDEKDLKEASVLSPMEQAERNKEYALYTMAILAKVYVDEVQRHTGNVVPLTDLPGVSAIVDTLRENSNSGVKISAIDALRYINKPEYKEELTSLFSLASKDSNPYVARNAALALESLNQ